MKTTFLRVLEIENKEEGLRLALAEPDSTCQRFDVDVRGFDAVPRSPFAYWAGENLRKLFLDHPRFESSGREAWVGLQTNDDFRWLRLWWEVPMSELTSGRARDREVAWVPYAKGGEFARYYSDIHLVVPWGNDGSAIKKWKRAELAMMRITENNSRCWNETKYFKSGLTWSQRSQVGLSVRALPEGSVFGIKGPAAFAGDEVSRKDLLRLLAVFNSSIFGALVEMQMAFGSYDTGVIRRTPVPEEIPERLQLDSLAEAGWKLALAGDRHKEVSRHFVMPTLVAFRGTSFADGAMSWARSLEQSRVKMEEVQAQIDTRCFELYGIDDQEESGLLAAPAQYLEESDTDTKTPDPSRAGDANHEPEPDVDEYRIVEELVSWAVGVFLRRFDRRVADSGFQAPNGVDPFEPLPSYSPGMLRVGDRSSQAQQPTVESSDSHLDGLLVDSPGHHRDIDGAVRSVLRAVFGVHAEAREHEAAEILGVSSLRDYFSRPNLFFDDHLSRYSRSRRQAPIYWPLSTASGDYTIWIYIHRLADQTLFTVVNDLVEPKLRETGESIKRLVAEGETRSRTDDRTLESLQNLEAELIDFRDELLRVAKFWNPNLDDGVQITASPLWKLFRLKKWQRKLKETWEKLEQGDYDWAHLAYSIWPDRVREKCKTDMSLAIAHGLEELYEEAAG